MASSINAMMACERSEMGLRRAEVLIVMNNQCDNNRYLELHMRQELGLICRGGVICLSPR